MWLDNRDADPLMQALANDSLGPLAQALAAVIDPDACRAASISASPASGMLSMLERLSSYLRDDVTEDARNRDRGTADLRDVT